MNAKRMLIVAAIVNLAALPAFAVCNQSGASQADQDLWNIHGCWTDFFLWQYQAYDLRGGDWWNRGWNDACNVNLEFPKHWNASYLVTYGLADDYWNSFHGTVDYRATAERWGNNYKNAIHHNAVDDYSIFGAWNWRLFDSNEVDTSCPLYDSGISNANPGSRAGDFMHEGWHGWQDRWGYQVGHLTNPWWGNCTMPGANCDYFYFHGISAYLFGDMWQTDGTANRFHSPNQVQVEFLCDVADYPQWWVPASVRTAAATDANTRAVQRFINGPGYRCGTPRPW